MSARQVSQHPEAEGPLERRVFGGPTAPIDWLPVTSLAPGVIAVGGGAARGLTVGSLLAV